MNFSYSPRYVWQHCPRILMLVMAFATALSVLLVKQLGERVPIAEIFAFRAITGIAIIWIITAFWKGSIGLIPKNLRPLFYLSWISFVAGALFMYVSIGVNGPSITLSVFYLSPIIVVGMCWWRDNETPTIVHYIVFSLCLVGVFLIFSPNEALAEVLMILPPIICAVGYALTQFYKKRISKFNINSITQVFYQNIIILLGAALIFIATNISNVNFPAVGLEKFLYGNWIYPKLSETLILISIGISNFFLQSSLVQALKIQQDIEKPSADILFLQYFSIIMVILSEFYILGATFAMLQVVGMLLIFASGFTEFVLKKFGYKTNSP